MFWKIEKNTIPRVNEERKVSKKSNHCINLTDSNWKKIKIISYPFAEIQLLRNLRTIRHRSQHRMVVDCGHMCPVPRDWIRFQIQAESRRILDCKHRAEVGLPRNHFRASLILPPEWLPFLNRTYRRQSWADASDHSCQSSLCRFRISRTLRWFCPSDRRKTSLVSKECKNWWRRCRHKYGIANSVCNVIKRVNPN